MTDMLYPARAARAGGKRTNRTSDPSGTPVRNERTLPTYTTDRRYINSTRIHHPSVHRLLINVSEADKDSTREVSILFVRNVRVSCVAGNERRTPAGVSGRTDGRTYRCLFVPIGTMVNRSIQCERLLHTTSTTNVTSPLLLGSLFLCCSHAVSRCWYTHFHNV